MTASDKERRVIYTGGPCYPELVLMVLTGVGHVVLELLSDGLQGAAETLNRPQHFYNITAAVLWGCYLLWRLIKTPGVAGAWGFQKAGFLRSLQSCTVFAIIAMVPLLVYGRWNSRFPVPATFWFLIIIYPVWGIAQQFALQALITRNIRRLVPKLQFRVLAASTVFCAAHFPNYRLMALTFVAGLAFTWIYEKHRNLWAIGVVHGVLGAIAYYVVLGQDLGAEIIGLLFSPV